MTLAVIELAEVIWDVAEPSLSREDRDTLCAAFHTCEPILAMCAALRAITRTQIRLPANVFDEFRSWLADVPPLQSTDRWLVAWLEIHVLASQVRPSSVHLTPIGGYSEYTLCCFVVAEAGVRGDAAHEAQAEAIRRWLAQNRPGPALRADMRVSGFAYLLDDQGIDAFSGPQLPRHKPPSPPSA